MISTTVDTESYFGSPREPVAIIITDGGHYPPADADRPFIAHAREDVPWLLARVSELEGLGQRVLDDIGPQPCPCCGGPFVLGESGVTADGAHRAVCALVHLRAALAGEP
jgi:hypothetical protein